MGEIETSKETGISSEIILPKEIESLIKEKLPTDDDQAKLVDFIRITADVMLNRQIRKTKIYPFSEEHVEDGIKKEQIPPDISDLILNNSQIFSKEIIAKLAGLESEEISDEQYQAILVSLVKSFDAESLLAKLGRTEPVVVLPGFRAYRSCTLTEKRLLNELRNSDASVVRLSFPDGTFSTLAVKFTDVTLGNCIESTNPSFQAGVSYRPIGRTKIWLDSLNHDKINYQEVDFSGDDHLKQIWSFNRPLEEKNFHVLGKHKEDQDIQVSESGNLEEIKIEAERLVKNRK